MPDTNYNTVESSPTELHVLTKNYEDRGYVDLTFEVKENGRAVEIWKMHEFCVLIPSEVLRDWINNVTT